MNKGEDEMSRTDKMKFMGILALVAMFAVGFLKVSAAAEVEALPGSPDESEVAPATPEENILEAQPSGTKAEKVIVAVPLEEKAGDVSGEATAGPVIIGVPMKGEPSATVIYTLPPLKGPKKSLGVMDFENKSSFSAQWNLGYGVSDMLSAALQETKRFVVVERPKIRNILDEQGLVVSGRAADEAGARLRNLIPAQIGVTGAVTEFSIEKQTTGAAVEQKDIDAGMVTGVAHVSINFRMFDTTTGQNLFSGQVERNASYTGIEGDYTKKTFAIGGGLFEETPLGKATQDAIAEAIYRIALNMDKVPWKGSVVLVQLDKVYINCGHREGIATGQEFVVYSKGEELTDPNTGELLGMEETKSGRISVVEVKEKYSIARIEAGANFKRGDVLRLE